MKSAGSECLSQQLMRRLSRIFFPVSALAVLIVTASYQFRDPLPRAGTYVSMVLTSVKNATFYSDDSVLRTGEDFSLSKPDNATIVDVEGPALSETTVIAEETDRLQLRDRRHCDLKEKKINCSYPGVLAAIVSYNLHDFPSLNFYAYEEPVRGSKRNQCDVSWRFRSKKEKSWRMYRDYRRFSLNLSKSCDYGVVKSFGWHSGKNAKSLRSKRRGPSGGNPSKPLEVDIPPSKNLTVIGEVETREDSVPIAPVSERTFADQRYLYYSRGGDHCKTMNHYMWSFLCSLGEAQYLNRTLVMDLNLCLSSSNNPGHGDEDGKDFRLYYDFAHLKASASVVEQKEFLQEWTQWNQKHPNKQIVANEISDYKVTPMQLVGDVSTIISRKFELAEPYNYWFRVCEGPAEKVIQRPWSLLWKSKRIMDIVNAICWQMEWDFDVVHVVRGDKARNKELWPNLDSDTSVDSLIEKLRDQLNSSRYVYIATNEMEPGYFQRLKAIYSHAKTLSDFNALWAKDSLWYNQTMELTGGSSVEFDGYMRVEVDTEVSVRAKKKIETFGFLTNDCKDGINTC